MAVFFASLVEELRRDADRQEEYGDPGGATAIRRCVDQFQEKLRECELEELTLKQAAKEAGVSYDTMQRRVSEGEVPNVGKKHKPLVRRGDLTSTRRGEPDLASQVLDLEP